MRQSRWNRERARTIVFATVLIGFCALLLLSLFGPHSWQIVLHVVQFALFAALAIATIVRREEPYLTVNWTIIALWCLGVTLPELLPHSALTQDPWSTVLNVVGILALGVLAFNIWRHRREIGQTSQHSRHIRLTPPLPDSGATASR